MRFLDFARNDKGLALVGEALGTVFQPDDAAVGEAVLLDEVLHDAVVSVRVDAEMFVARRRVINYAASRFAHLRIDTHRDNRIMQRLIEKHGFTYCGIIWLEDGTERLAYER